MWKQRKLVMRLAVIGVAAVSFYVGRKTAEPRISLNFRPQTRTIEFYRYGELAQELQPDDGQIYYELVSLINDEAS